jgi:hypothetical protein
VAVYIDTSALAKLLVAEEYGSKPPPAVPVHW